MPASLPTPLPANLSGSGTGGSSAVLTSPWDVVIGSYGFMLNNDPNTPLVRTGADYRSPYVNYSGAPGEQALGFWWPRTQYAWHGGAGNPTFDGLGSGDATIALTRFDTSAGIDVLTTLSQFSLLFDTDFVTSVGATPTEIVSLVDSSLGGLCIWGDGANLKRYNGSTVATWLAAVNPISICTDGVATYYVNSTGVSVISSSGGFAMYSLSGHSRYLIRFAKQRLILALDNSLYELVIGTAGPAALPTPFFTHPNPNWTWTDVAAGPGAIYASGSAGTTGAVYMFVLNTSTGALPVLSGGITACEMPDGETPLCLNTYLDLFIGIGTSEGLRVSSYNSDNSIILAPLTFDDMGPVLDITAWSRFFYTACQMADDDNNVGLMRVDLSFTTDSNRYAYQRDIRANNNPAGFSGVTGTVSSVVMFNGSPVFLVPGAGMYAQSPTRYCSTGFLQSSKMYFGMTDYKIFERGSFTMSGQGEVTMSTSVDSETGFVTRAVGNAGLQSRVEANIGGQRGTFLKARFDLQRPTTTETPIVLGYSMRALPSQAREDAWTLPLRCYDRVEGPFGETVHQSAISVVNAVADLMRFQTPVIFQTFFGEPQDDWVTYLVQVETYEFKQATAEDGWGGTLTLSLRTLTGE